MIGYPNKKQTVNQNVSIQSHSSRGMSLEHDLNLSNTYYRETKRALIYKKPTPIQVVHVDYPLRSAAKITEAYYQTPSTTDYNGIYRGKAIDYEAKETKSKTSFPFQSIHPHQIQHLKDVLYHGGIAFFIIRFITYDETYLVDARIIIERYDVQNKKSISYQDIRSLGSLIHQGLAPRLRYLDNVDTLYFKEESL